MMRDGVHGVGIGEGASRPRQRKGWVAGRFRSLRHMGCLSVKSGNVRFFAPLFSKKSGTHHGNNKSGDTNISIRVGLRFKQAVCLLILISIFFPSEGITATWSFAQQQRLFRPLLADPGEPRFGIFTYLNNNRLEGVIGGSWEAFDVAWDDRTTLRFGIHSGVFALLRKTGSTFPLDTADFLISTHTDVQRGRFTGRFEFGHISAHIVDGFNDPVRNPITYSREFFTLYGSYQRRLLRLYSSIRVSNHAIPNLKRWRLQFGGELISGRLPGHIPRVYIAYDVRIFDGPGTVAGQTAQLGVVFHSEQHTGLRIALIAHTGRSEHGQFHDLTDRFVGLGLFFDM